ncbi:hypothetical protein [uncultured Pantoea sp.]|uniref:hypothetical protein n=1 Tax=uncultured Pantoea sp. TaxID=218084 RepID=UPI0025F5A912|nr:hypothetical protein [uncultured Pantoea sp.]
MLSHHRATALLLHSLRRPAPGYNYALSIEKEKVVKSKIYLPQFDISADVEIFGNKLRVRYEGNENFPKRLKVKEQYFVVIDGKETTMVLERKAIGSWQFFLQS